MDKWMDNSTGSWRSPRSGRGEQVSVGLDIAWQHLQLDVAFVVDAEDLGYGRVGVAAPDDDVAPGDRNDPLLRVSEASHTRPSRLFMKSIAISTSTIAILRSHASCDGCAPGWGSVGRSTDRAEPT